MKFSPDINHKSTVNWWKNFGRSTTDVSATPFLCLNFGNIYWNVCGGNSPQLQTSLAPSFFLLFIDEVQSWPLEITFGFFVSLENYFVLINKLNARNFCYIRLQCRNFYTMCVPWALRGKKIPLKIISWN